MLKGGESMKVISICDHKGGVGKTTTAGALAQGLAKKKKNKVLLIDGDPQGTATSSVYGVTDIRHTLYDVITGKVTASRAVISTEAGDLIPYDKQLANLDIEYQTNNVKQMMKNYGRLKEALTSLEGSYTHVIIDTAPGLASLITWQALTASDNVLIPIVCSPDNYDNLKLTIEDVENIKEVTNPDINISGVFFNLHGGRSNIMKQFEELYKDTCKQYGIKLLKTTVRRSVTVQEAHALGQSLFDYSPKAPVTNDYKSLIEELKF